MRSKELNERYNDSNRGRSMDIAKMTFDGFAPRNPRKIVERAINEIGEEFDFVLWVATKYNSTKIDWDDINASDWFLLCKLLYLNMDSFTFGYYRLRHIGAIFQPLRDGNYRWRKTKAVLEIIDSLNNFEISNWNFSIEHSGNP